MNISDNFRELLVKEIKHAVKMMDQSKEANSKLYYFSAVRGVIQRVFNFDYDPELVYAELVTGQTHQAFTTRLTALQSHNDSSVPLTEEQFSKLSTFTKQLAKNIEKKDPIDDVLKKFILLLYTTTGNGYYLYQKGVLKI